MCHCYHLTNFAVLVDIYGLALSEQHKSYLDVLTYIGCTISICSLGVCIFVFMTFRSAKNDRSTINANLCLCLCLRLCLPVCTRLCTRLWLRWPEGGLTCTLSAILIEMILQTWVFCLPLNAPKQPRKVFDWMMPLGKTYSPCWPLLIHPTSRCRN